MTTLKLLRPLTGITTTLLAVCTLTGCTAAKEATHTTREVGSDSVLHYSLHYDSTYISDSFLMDYHPSKELLYLHDSLLAIKVDTVYIRDTKRELHYRLLHDTTYVQRTDTVTVVHEVEVLKPTPYIPRWLLATLAITLVLLLLRLLQNRNLEIATLPPKI